MKRSIIITVSLLFSIFCLSQAYKSKWWALGTAAGCTIAIFLNRTHERWEDWYPGRDDQP